MVCKVHNPMYLLTRAREWNADNADSDRFPRIRAKTTLPACGHLPKNRLRRIFGEEEQQCELLDNVRLGVVLIFVL
jgi:hypothetical protein